LAATLLELAREHGMPDSQGILVPLRLSQQDLANLIGVTRESVNISLSDFRRRGLVVVEGRAFRLPRPEALAPSSCSRAGLSRACRWTRTRIVALRLSLIRP
jgi:biotin operon repressor